jgi:hypothetical protein
MQSRSISTCPAPKFLLSHGSIQDSLVNICNQRHTGQARQLMPWLHQDQPSLLKDGKWMCCTHAA